MRKFIFYFAYALPLIWWVYGGLSGKLGAEPIDLINWQTGYAVLYLLLINLLLGILIAFRWTKVPAVKYCLQERRSLGVAAGVYVVLHFLTYLTDEAFEPKAWTQIIEKFYLQVGASAGVILVVLTLTSNNFAVRRLGFKRWKNIHRFVYLAFFFVMLHVLNIEKGNLPLLVLLTVPVGVGQIWRFLRWGRGQLPKLRGKLRGAA